MRFLDLAALIQINASDARSGNGFTGPQKGRHGEDDAIHIADYIAICILIVYMIAAGIIALRKPP